MELAFSSAVDGKYPLGDKCHQQQQGAVPVWIVTDIHGNILLNNQAEEGGKAQWVVAKGRITVTRFWSASTAMLVCNVQSLGRKESDLKYGIFPELPRGVTRVLSNGGYGSTDYPLDKNDEICIWCGYIDSFRPVEKQDLIDGRLVRTFVGVIDTLVGSGSANTGTTLIIQCRDRMKYLMDSLSTYNSTDFIPIGVRAESQIEDGATYLDTTKTDEKNISRAVVILELARRSIGHLENAYSVKDLPQCSCVCGLKVSQGYTKDYIFDKEESDSIFSIYEGPTEGRDYYGLPVSNTAAPPPNTKFASTAPKPAEGSDGANTNAGSAAGGYDGLLPEGSTEGQSTPGNDSASPAADSTTNKDVPSEAESKGSVPFIGGTTRTPAGLSDKELALRARHLAMNIVTGRMPFDSGFRNQNFSGMSAQVTDRVPVEYIKFLAMQEPWPTEFFCDHRSGEFWYAPRALDVTGFEDSKRFRRTYFYRHASDEALRFLKQEYAHPCQALLLFREESSSINWRSNIIVTNATSTSSPTSQVVHLKIVPPFLTGRAFACTYYTVVDETISSGSTTELTATAMAFARLYGKELKAATMHVIGDPTMCPGEAIQVLGSPLYGGGYMPAKQDIDQTQWVWDRNAVTDYVSDYKAVNKQILEELQTALETGTDSAQGPNLQAVDNVLNSVKDPVAGGAPATPIPGLPTGTPGSVTNLEAVKDKYSDIAKVYGLPDPGDKSSEEDYFKNLNTEYKKRYGIEFDKDVAALEDANLTPSQLVAKYQKLSDLYYLQIKNPPTGNITPEAAADYKSRYMEGYQNLYKQAPHTLDETNMSPTQIVERYEAISKSQDLTGWFGLAGPKKPSEPYTAQSAAEFRANVLRTYQQKTGKPYTEGITDTALAPPPGTTGKTSISDLEAQRRNTKFIDSLELTQAEMMCPALFNGNGLSNTDAPLTPREDPRTIWRCEAVIHKFNDSPGDGYKTEVALLSPW